MALQCIGIIADDLTGAADTTLAFWQHGFATFILLDGTDDICLRGDVAVTIDTDSRHVSPQESAARVTGAVRRLRAMGIDTFYKKIDSTLRGNLGAEIEAMMQAESIAHAIICPAFPVMERVVVGGRVLVKGIDLMQTSAANDPRCPVTSSRIAEILAQQTTIPIEELTYPDTASNGDNFTAQSPNKRITVVDAQTNEDLWRWIQHFGRGPDLLWVGAAGLAELLASTHTRARASSPEPAIIATVKPSKKSVLVVAGSIHIASREQIKVLTAQDEVTAIPVDPAALVGGTFKVEPLVQRVCQALSVGQHCMLYTDHSPEVLTRLNTVLDALHCTYEHGGGLIARCLSKIVSTILSTVSQPVDLVLTGGDTAKPILAQLHIPVLRVVQMVAPGTPISETLDGSRQIVTKAGGFGNPEILVQAIHALTARY